MAYRFEAEISPGMAPREVVDLAQIAEDAGFDRLGISCVALWPDTYQLQALIAAKTSRIAIGSMVTNPYTRHAAVHAAALATLDELSDGRAFCALGVGAGLEALGMHYRQPVRTLRECVTAIKRLLAGETVSMRGATLTLDDARLFRPPTHKIPIAIGTRSEQVMRLAGELADIALVGARHFTPALVAQYRGWLAEGAALAGRSPDAIEIMPRITLCISRDERLAINSVKRFAAHYLDILGDRGPSVDPARRAAILDALKDARGWYFDLARYDPPALLDLVDDGLARAFSVVGTPEQCAEQIRALLALGFQGLSCNLAPVNRASNYLGFKETLEGAAEMLALLK
ncbi:MAG TPA: LLM class flavin-dependent oxidoreductase [Alphaproteobacteria bacterium]|nr:LLM class flavin-dependent oxidoreductase [Alphaproteobacteria bacterium]